MANQAVIMIGILFIVLGVLASAYTVIIEKDRLIGTDIDTSKPYQGYSVPMIVAGVILVLVGAVIPEESTPTHTHERVIVKKKYKNDDDD
jgi:hypothetical protein